MKKDIQWMQRNKKNGGSPPIFRPSSLNAVTLPGLSNIVKAATTKVDQEVQQCLRTSLSDLRKIQISFYETDIIRILNGLRSPKPRKTINNRTATRCHAPPQSSVLLHIYKKSRLHFTKVESPLNPAVLDLQNPKNSASNDEPRIATRHQKVCWSPASFHALTRTDSSLPRVSMMPHALTCAPLALWCHNDVASYFQLDPVPLTRPKSVTRSESPEKKNGVKKKALTKQTFDFDQKVKIFKKGLTHSVFHVHSNFGICFIIRNLEIVQTIQFLKNWLLHKSWSKSQNFQEVPVLPNFSRRSQFLGSISSFRNLKLLK